MMTFDLGKTAAAALAKEKGEHALYMAHVTELCRWLLSQGVTPMFWGDIMWRHPEAYAEIPQGVICLNWGYLPNQRENEIRDLAQMGAVQYACPGVCTWKQLVPLLRYGFSNNRVMCAHAHKYHAIGMLNTDWGDYGHLCQPAFSVPGILYGAAFAWNANGWTTRRLTAPSHSWPLVTVPAALWRPLTRCPSTRYLTGSIPCAGLRPGTRPNATPFITIPS